MHFDGTNNVSVVATGVLLFSPLELLASSPAWILTVTNAFPGGMRLFSSLSSSLE
jgi:hypothetical protein